MPNIKTYNIQVIDPKPKDISVINTKSKGISVFGETVAYTDTRLVAKGQLIPMLGLTYPTAGTFTNAPRL